MIFESDFTRDFPSENDMGVFDFFIEKCVVFQNRFVVSTSGQEAAVYHDLSTKQGRFSSHRRVETHKNNEKHKTSGHIETNTWVDHYQSNW